MASKLIDLEDTPTVYLVDDDPGFSEWLAEVLQSIHVELKAFLAPSAFLSEFDPERWGCILLDMRLPEMSGLKLQKHLMAMQVRTPVLIVTAYGEVSMAVEALKSGAVDFIQKPCSAQALLDRIQQAIEIGRERLDASAYATEICARLASLSPRELETMELLLDGKTTKQIASLLDIGMTTVDYHRNNVLQRMNVDNTVSLARLMHHYRECCGSKVN